MEADDAMAALLAGYLSEEDPDGADEDDEEELETSQENRFAPAVEHAVQLQSTRTAPSCTKAVASCDLAMYSDDSDEEDRWTGTSRACGGG